jgi:ornithine decarboxylase
MTFDCINEVDKIHSIYPEAELVLRIAVENTNAPAPMGKKFGAVFELWEPILIHCKELGMRVKGVSFHVGSGGCAFEQYENSLKHAEQIFEMAERLGMPAMDLLDIGGGFSENSSTAYTTREYMFPVVAPLINEYLTNVWPAKKAGISIIAEPGRYVCQGSTALVSQVFGKKKQGNVNHYYITSGIYQGLSCVIVELDWFKSQLICKDEEEF